MKRIIRTVLGVLLACCLLCGSLPAVSAAATVPMLEAGETWHGSWDASQTENYLDLTVSQTGFYTLTVTDHKQTGYTMIRVRDMTDGKYVATVGPTPLGSTPYESELLLMSGGHRYSVTVLYGDSREMAERYDAEMAITFEKSPFVPTDLPDTDVNVSSVMTALDVGEKEWFRVTAADEGDYVLCFSAYIGAQIDLYRAATGGCVETRFTEYELDGLWYKSKQMTFRLEANTEYYIRVFNDKNAVTTRLSMPKNAQMLSCIKLGAATKTLASNAPVPDSLASYFDYTIVYVNGTSQSVSYQELCQRGLRAPTVTHTIDEVQVNGESVLKAGKHPVTAWYDGVSSRSTIKVMSLAEQFLSLGATVVKERTLCELTANGEKTQRGHFLLGVSKTGVYQFYPVASENVMVTVTYSIIDEHNRIVVPSEKGFPLVAGRTYTLSVRYTFTGTYKRYLFCFEMSKPSLFPDAGANTWYSDAVTYAVGAGVMSGYQNGKFGTSDGIQRQDFLVMLARLDGVDLGDYSIESGRFPDVARNSYYEAAVAWGYENGIVTGYQNGRFGVGDKITREQLVTFLQRYARYKGYEALGSTASEMQIARTYTDFKNVTAFAKNAVVWAIENGVIKGKTATKIVPQGNAQRCEVAQMMYNVFLNDVL